MVFVGLHYFSGEKPAWVNAAEHGSGTFPPAHGRAKLQVEQSALSD